MPTLVLDPPPAEFAALLERRRRIGADRHDEVWEGVLHMAPAARNARGAIQQQLAELLGPLARARDCTRCSAASSTSARSTTTGSPTTA